MAFSHGKGTVVLVGASDLSCYLNNVDWTATADTHETTTFCQDAKTYIPGLKDATASLSGLFDGDADAVDEVLAGAIGGAPQVVTIGTESMAAGKSCRMLKALESEYSVSSPVGDVVAVDASIQADGGILAGVSLQPVTTTSSTGNGSAVDNGASTSNGGVAHLHVMDFDGSSGVIKVQHSADGNTWADLIEFDALSGATVQRKEVTGTVNRYLRAVRSSGTFTSITYAVAFARR